MNEIFDFFNRIFDVSDWPPRWHCGHWTSFHGWLYIISDVFIWAAYYTIPLIILHFITKKKQAKFVRVYWLFAAFILACGFTHLLDAITFWYPVYRLNALARLITAVISWITVYHLVKLLPFLGKLKTEEELIVEIERRKILEQELIAKNELLIDAEKVAKIGHWHWDVKADIVTASEHFFKIYEVPFIESATRGAMHPYIHHDDVAFVKERGIKALETGEYGDFYFRIITPSGNQKIINAKGIVKLNEKGEAIHILGTIQDVTEQKQNETELLQKTQALESLNADLQKFAYIASHDLQEPLRKITTFISLVQKQYSGSLDAKGQEYLNKTVDATTRMQNLIESILSFSRLPTQEMKFTTVQLNEVIALVLTDLELKIKEKNARIVKSNLPVIEANSNQLQQVFLNLISNSIKFSRPGHAPEITVTAELIKAKELQPTEFFIKQATLDYAHDDVFCRITVADNGIGFEEQYFNQIFLPFQRLHSRTEFEGTGIGLAICKKIVENHSGVIEVKSIVGAGSKFIITLPVKQVR